MSPVKRRPKARKIKGEGWDVFQSGSDDGSMQISAIDDPCAAIPESDPRMKADLLPAAAFPGGDDEAIRHVLRLAKRGDDEAIDALWEVLDHDGLLNRILWCEAMGWKGPRDAAYPEGFAERWYEETGYWVPFGSNKQSYAE